MKLKKEISMKVDLVSLNQWVETMPGSPRLQKEEAAALLEVGVATIYRWIKEGNVFIDVCGVYGEDYGQTYIWEIKKSVEA